MIKGVNKRIIEINHPDSLYFEKAIFYLKPNVREIPTVVTEAEVQKYICRLGAEQYRRKKSSRFRNIFFLLAVLASAGSIAFVFLH